ncbi:MAG: S9 family peptidase [Krumholzibacteria bacterium]|nr:S9 family peptidase [Candidatus Krumholzibacteria bacterium]
MAKRALLLVMSLLVLAGAGCGREPQPPLAAVLPHGLTIHGDTRVDDYYWLRERGNPEVIAYLEAENAYTEAMLADTRKLQDALFAEMKGRIKEDESSAPWEKDGWTYYTRFVEGGEYPLHCRRPGGMDGAEQVMFDGNAMAAGHDFFSLRGVEVSPDSRLAAFAVDTVGRRFYTVRIMNLETGLVLEDAIPDVTGNVAWALDNRTLFYSRQDPRTLRSWQIWRHELGTPVAADVLVYQEDDETFACRVARSKSDRYLLIASTQTLSSEYRILEADDPAGEFRVFQPRQRDLEYTVDHQGGRFLIRTNLFARNFRLMECPLDQTWLAHWREVVPHREDVLLEDVEVFSDWLVLTERSGGLSHLRIVPMDGGPDHTLDFGEPTWSVWSELNPQMDTDVLRYGYTSLTTPRSTYTYDMAARTKTLLKQQEVLGGFDPADYRAEYVHVRARDGVEVPVSLVYRLGLARDGSAPLLLYGYGSYGASSGAFFRSTVLSLLDRGFVYAIAHVRGGEELGRQWYEDGKLLRKMNTFTDFIDCGRALVDQGFTSRDRLFAMGGSAGGLLVGAVINLEPDLWKGAVAQVPFVDVVTTMLDETIPLTTGEYDEWGDPRDEVYYDYMLGYSPYDRVEAKAYPALLVTAGLHDSQVQYWEPAKWVARLRALKTDDNPLLLRTNLDAGHGGRSGRFRSLEETAVSYAFMLDLAGIRR